MIVKPVLNIAIGALLEKLEETTPTIPILRLKNIFIESYLNSENKTLYSMDDFDKTKRGDHHIRNYEFIYYICKDLIKTHQPQSKAVEKILKIERGAVIYEMECNKENPKYATNRSLFYRPKEKSLIDYINPSDEPMKKIISKAMKNPDHSISDKPLLVNRAKLKTKGTKLVVRPGLNRKNMIALSVIFKKNKEEKKRQSAALKAVEQLRERPAKVIGLRPVTPVKEEIHTSVKPEFLSSVPKTIVKEEQYLNLTDKITPISFKRKLAEETIPSAMPQIILGYNTRQLQKQRIKAEEGQAVAGGLFI